MQYDYFIATRWRNKDQAVELARKLRQKGKSVYCFADPENSHLDPSVDPEEEMKAFEAIVDWRHDPKIRAMFEKDMNGLRESKVFIMLLPAGKSAHMEAGAAYGMSKECVLIGEQKETESLYLIFMKTYSSAEDFLKQL